MGSFHFLWSIVWTRTKSNKNIFVFILMFVIYPLLCIPTLAFYVIVALNSLSVLLINSYCYSKVIPGPNITALFYQKGKMYKRKCSGQ